MDLRSLISKLEQIENLKENEVMEAAPTEFVPTHFHKNNLGFRTSVMLHSDGKFYHKTKNNQYGTPGYGQEIIAPWNGNPENRSAMNPASIDGEFVNGQPVDYPEGITYKTFNKEGQGARASGTMDTLPTDDQNKTSNYTGQDQKTPEPAASKETDELAKDIETATKLLDKAEGKAATSGQAAMPTSTPAPATQPAMSYAGINVKESIYSKLVESFGYVAEALSALTPEEQKQLTDVMSKLGPMKDQRPEVQSLVDRYMALQQGTAATEPVKKNDEPSGEPAAEPSAEEPLLGPEDLKKAVARFKELLDKSLMREPEGQGPMPTPPKPKPRKPTSGPYLGAGNSPGNVTMGGSLMGPAHTGQWNGQDVEAPAGWAG